jgi:hypothetical protein
MENQTAERHEKLGGGRVLSDELLTKKEVARRLRISQRKIELDPNFPSIRWGRTVRYDWQAVMEYLKGGTVA